MLLGTFKSGQFNGCDHAGSSTEAGKAEEVLLCLVLVAVRDIEDEELLLNYRLSPGLARPAWYTPVDAAEDQRRWA